MSNLAEKRKQYLQKVQEDSARVWEQDRPEIDPIVNGLGYSITLHAGKEVRDKVFEGKTSKEISDIYRAEDPSPGGIVKWLKPAIERLDALVDEGTRYQIMKYCGAMCAQALARKSIEETKERIKKYKTIDEFLEAGGFKEGTLYVTYKPYEVTRTRCYCLGNGLPAEETMSPTYCHCAVGHNQYLWDVHGLPVKVELIHSALCGSNECKFEFRWIDEKL
jgi:hypothetical protein